MGKFPDMSFNPFLPDDLVTASAGSPRKHGAWEEPEGTPMTRSRKVSEAPSAASSEDDDNDNGNDQVIVARGDVN